MDQPLGVNEIVLTSVNVYYTTDLVVKIIGVSNMVIKTTSDTLMISVLVDGYYKTKEI